MGVSCRRFDLLQSLGCGGVTISMFVKDECIKFQESNNISNKFYRYLLNIFKRQLRVLSRSKKMSPSLAEDLLHDFLVKKFPKICQILVQEGDQILQPDAYLQRSVTNFLKDQIKAQRRIKVESLDNSLSPQESENDFIDIIPCETEDAYGDVLAEDFYKELLRCCAKRKTDFKRYMCFLISKTFMNEEKYNDPSWSNSYKYKIIERTRKFLKDFAEKYSVEEKIMGKVLLKFLSEMC